LPRPAPPVRLSALAQLKNQEPRLARTSTAREEAVVLTDLAEAALAEAAKRLDDPARVRALADRFDLIVNDALLPRAREVPADQREAVLSKLAERFSRTESDASRLAAPAAGRHASTVASLTRIAATARTADVRLRELARKTA
jgi:hypothetical protein